MSTKISKSQQEVWDWKQRAFEKLLKIPREKWLEEIRKHTKPLLEEINKAVKSEQKK